MALQYYRTVIGNDTDVNGKNYAAAEPVYIRNLNGTFAAIYSDSLGQNEIIQDGSRNITNQTGEFSFFCEHGKYLQQVKDKSIPIEVFGIDGSNDDIQVHNSDPAAHPELSAFITSEADRAEAAADSSALSGNVYADTTAGIAATSDGDYFSVVSPDDSGYLDLYLNSSGSAVFQKSYPSAKKVADLQESLNGVYETRGFLDQLPNGSNASFGTYTFAKPLYRSGQGIRYYYKSLVGGTIYVQVSSKTGDVITVVSEVAVQVDVGEGSVELPDLSYMSGQYIGVRCSPSGALAAIAGLDPDGGWWFTTAAIAEGQSYTDSTLTTTTRIVHRFDLIEQVVTAGNFNELNNEVNNIKGRDVAETFNLHFVVGESHAAGVPTTLSAVDIPNGNGFCYRRATNSLGHLQDPTGNSATAIAGSGRGTMFPSFGHQILRQSSNLQGAIVVNSANGGTTAVGQWASGGTSWLQAVQDYNNSLAEIESAGLIVSGKSISIILGSNDAAAGTTKSSFKAAMLDLIARTRALFGAGDKIPVTLMQTGYFADGSYPTEVGYIQDAQSEIVKENANVYMGYTAKFALQRGQMIDNVHMNQNYNDACGASLAIPSFVHGSGV